MLSECESKHEIPVKEVPLSLENEEEKAMTYRNSTLSGNNYV